MDPRYKLRCFDQIDHQKYRNWLEEEAESLIKTSHTQKELTRQNSGSSNSSITAEQSEFISMLSQDQVFEKEQMQTDAPPQIESDLKVLKKRRKIF